MITLKMTERRAGPSGTFYEVGQTYTLDDGIARLFLERKWADYISGIEVPSVPGVDGGIGSKSYDIAIYGANFSGIMAAISAKKQGRSVIVIEPRDGKTSIGGMVTSGIQHTDAFAVNKTTYTITGLTDSFYSQAAEYYGISRQTYMWENSYALESSVALSMLLKLIEKYNIEVVVNAKLQSLVKEGTKIVSAKFDTIPEVKALQWIDVSYHGDLLAMAGCDFIIGREAAATYSEASYKAGYNVDSANQPPTKAVTGMTWSGGVVTVNTAWVTGYANGDPVNITIAGATPAGYNGTYIGTATGASSFTFPLASNPGANSVLGTIKFNIDAYVTVGNPASGLIPFVQEVANQTAGLASPVQQAMGYRLSITETSGKNIPFPAPANYNPAMFEIHRRWFKAYGQGLTLATDVLLFQNALLADYGKKVDVNNKGFVALDYVHPESTEWVTASWSRRLEIEENIKQYTLGLFYFWKNDPSVPVALRNNMAIYGLCADEYPENGGMPYYPYPRQGRRGIGDAVTTGVTLATISATSPAALSYYTYDEHPCQFVNAGGIVQQEGGLTGISAGGSKIPFTAIMPKASQCTNLLYTFCGNFSQVAFSATRLEPIVGQLGETAAIVASLAIAKNVPVQSVSPSATSKIVDIYGWNNIGSKKLSTDNSSYVDNVSMTVSGTWSDNATLAWGTASIKSCNATSGVNTLKFTPNSAKIRTGLHDIYLNWADSNSVATRGSPTITITANGVITTIVVNQSNSGEGGNWFHLGRYYIRSGNATDNNVLVIHDNTSNATNVIGCKFVPVASQLNPL